MTIENLLKKKNVDFQKNVLLSSYTTMGVGGETSYLAEIKDRKVLEDLLITATDNNIPFLLLGRGSNVIISDEGFKGLVLINKTDSWQIIDKNSPCFPKKNSESRLEKINIPEQKEHKGNYSLVRADSGISVSFLAQRLYKENISGLEWFAGIPASIGGAIYMNMHGGHKYFGDLVVRAKLFSGKDVKTVGNGYFKFDYDHSILQTTKEIVLWAELCLPNGNIEEARKTAKQWSKNKSNQPQKSAGCVFRNLTEDEKQKAGLPSLSIGYLIDKELGLKGYQLGGAKISEQHAAFIENTGNATAADVFRLVEFIKTQAKEKLNIELQPEIEFIGNF